MATYKITSGRYARFERGSIVQYKVGQLIELTDAEAEKLKSLVEKVEVATPTQVSSPSMRVAIPPKRFGGTVKVGRRD